MADSSPVFLRMAALHTLGLSALYAAMRLGGIAAVRASTLTAAIAGAALILLTPVLLRVWRDPEKPAAARIVPHACAAVGACFAAVHASNQPLFLLAGFLLGVGYAVYGLMKDIDVLVAPRTIMAVSMAQILALLLVLG